LAKEMTSET